MDTNPLQSQPLTEGEGRGLPTPTCSISSINPKGAIIVRGSAETLDPRMMEALTDAKAQGITVIFTPDPIPDHVAILEMAPPLPEIPRHPFREKNYHERANPNQPWYAKFDKRRRRKF
jgi:hypothetical protein